MSPQSVTLADCEESSTSDYSKTRWTHESGAYVELIHDDHPHNPLDDMEGIAISYREGSHYCGTMADHPSDPTITCPICDGYGETILTPQRVCLRCTGSGDLTVSLLEWFRHEHDAIAIHEFSTGSHNEASAVIVITDSDWTDPAGAAEAFAAEYRSWAEGDVWGIEYGAPGIEPESCWGFIGRDYAESEAVEMLGYAIESARSERTEAAHCAARDIITI